MKRRFLCFCALLMTVLLSLGSVTVFAEEQSEDDDVYVSVYTDKTDYQVGDMITVVAEVTNRGTANISGLSMSFALPEGITINTGKPDVSDITVAGGSVFRKTVFATIESAPAETETETETTDEPTNEKDGVPVWVWIVGGAVLLVAAVGAAVFLVLKKKKAAKALCLLLGFVMALNVFAGPAMADEDTTAETTASEAETETQPEPTAPEKAPDTILTAEAAITVDGKNCTIKVALTVPGATSDELSDFASDEIYFVSGEENMVTFTVKAGAGRNDIQLIKGENEVVGIMHDDGVEGDEVAMDGVYSFLTLAASESVTAAQQDYHCEASDEISTSITLFFFAKMTEESSKDATEIYQTSRQVLFDIESEYTAEDGYVPLSQYGPLFAKIENQFQQWMTEGKIVEYSIDDNSANIKFASGLGCVYSPAKQGTDSNSTDCAVTVITCQPQYTDMGGAQFSTSMYELPTGINSVLGMVDAAATDIDHSFENYSFRDTHNYNDSGVTLEVVRSFGEGQVVLWHGHGYYDDKYKSCLCTGESFDWNAYYWDLSYFIDCVQNRIINGMFLQSDTVIISSKYIKKYCKNLDGSLFYLAACDSGHSPELAEAFISNGAVAVVANSLEIMRSYNVAMMYGTVENMLQLSPMTGQYYTLQQALEMAKNQYGINDTIYGGIGSTPMIFGGSDAENYQFDNKAHNGVLSGKVAQASDRSTPIPGAVIAVYPIIGDKPHMISTRVATASTSGNYYLNLPAGEYQLSIRAAGYVPFAGRFTVAPNQNTYVETFLLVEGEADPTTGTVISTGIAKGRIFNALTGRGLGNATLTIYNDWGSIRDNTPVTIIQTDGSGYYSVELPFGYYTVHLSKEDFNDDEFNIVVQAGTTDEQNGTISPVIEGDGYLITLTWGENPNDVDSHMVGTYSDGNTQFHVYFHDKEKYDGEIPVCILDYDDTSSYGPEHITLIPTSNKPYYYYLHRYAGSGTLASSEALVTVIQNNRIIASYNVPTDRGSGDYWNIFAIKNGRIITRNTITDSPELHYAD